MCTIPVRTAPRSYAGVDTDPLSEDSVFWLRACMSSSAGSTVSRATRSPCRACRLVLRQGCHVGEGPLPRHGEVTRLRVAVADGPDDVAVVGLHPRTTPPRWLRLPAQRPRGLPGGPVGDVLPR